MRSEVGGGIMGGGSGGQGEDKGRTSRLGIRRRNGGAEKEEVKLYQLFPLRFFNAPVTITIKSFRVFS